MSEFAFVQQSLQPKLSCRHYASVSYALQNNTVFRRTQNWVSVSDASRTDNGSEFQSSNIQISYCDHVIFYWMEFFSTVQVSTVCCLCFKVPDDWDLVKTADVRKMSPTHSLLTTSNMIIGSLSKTVSNVTKAIGLYNSLLHIGVLCPV